MDSERDAEPSRAAPAVELDGVTKRYGDTAAVDDVSLRVREGEFFTLVGPSGCGKTTTLRLIAGFEEPTAGTVRFAGDSVAGVPPEDRDVGVVFQNYALFPHMTVGENVGYGLNFADPPDGVSREERVAELLELVDLPDAADRDPESLSGGQRQRVAMARALAPGPDLLLLDEPMSALDAQLRERLRVQVRTIQSELGITTVYVTHDQEEALAISDRVAVMRDGTPEQVAPPRTVYREPSSRFVAAFVGDNNVFAGRVVDVDEPVARDGEREGTTRIAAVDVDGETLRVAIDDATAYGVTPGDRLTFCVRPEYLRIGDGASRLRATVASAEFLGETTRVTLDWGGRDLVVRTRDPLSGEVVVGFDPADAHVIAADDG
ncbi:spermidine/putrescine ABC transporter ATP-binding protein [Halorubrum persicum]|uniref:Molybdate/tungstate import ATP-binding protein WtpC n=1 Tax=Halorubrum persicum TaxID=1383844 RepID=A0A2G1WLG3_9EURY|nr:ABC transporter ATP-binding protein [Halorubrum persicum]PHQ39848.1 spermidine/putrescine ABC transporter ATP-binding protein [Halorubrum persicum]